MEMGLDVTTDITRKRKASGVPEMTEVDDDDMKIQRLDQDDSKKQNHSEIEKRRRDKMNMYITELSSMVPMCNAMSRKLDKLTVLRMAVQHMKTLRGTINSYTEGHYKPSFLSDEELKHVIVQAADGFLFVVSCDRGRILFVSESVSQILNYSQGDLLGQNWFDILHPKDIAKVKEQLSSSDLSPKERLIDAKTMLPVKTGMPQTQSRLCPGARRSFFCRMKCKSMPSVKEEADTTTGCHKRRKSQSSDRKYCVIHCTGYLKSWAPAKLNLQEENEGDSEGCNLSCLVAVGRIQQRFTHPGPPRDDMLVQPIEFVSRHAIDGKFLFVDQRATLLLGYLPQELLGTSCYEYYHQDDIPALTEVHKQVLQTNERITSQTYRFRTKEGHFVCLQTSWKNFRNPWTREIEYLIAVNTLVPIPDVAVVESSNSSMDELMKGSSSSFDAVLSSALSPSSSSTGTSEGVHSRLIGSGVGVSKIGQQVADEVLHELQSRNHEATRGSPNLENLSLVRLGSQQSSSGEGSRKFSSSTTQLSNDVQSNLNPMIGAGIAFGNIPHNTPSQLGGMHQNSMTESDLLMDTFINQEMAHSYQNNSNDGNDEAAMAVIMSLLEADAGLGGPVDFSGLPWPLP